MNSNPLHAILSLSDLILDEREKLTGDLYDDASSIRASSQLMLAILDDVLDMSSIESGKIRFDSVPVAIRDVIYSQARAFRAQAQQKQLRLDCSIAANVPRYSIPPCSSISSWILVSIYMW
jgi:signal transduction histidine kinase